MYVQLQFDAAACQANLSKKFHQNSLNIWKGGLPEQQFWWVPVEILGDSLVFRYDSDLHFTMQVFDESSCEKEVSYNADCIQGATDMYNLALKKRDRGNSVILDCIVEGIPKKMRSSEIPSECTSSQDTNGLTSSKDGYTPEDAICS
ncbi:hypothetical protein KY290_000441 [Solanum tuberosum]|uniref:Uncharacterized protein n=1 Tax=Solanum tuberosum TaxID=4113 RepID=A0ABQ7WJG4_SOLTU|nr:hypothetical protein KY284_000487 [Solanum tuberosum]KAH0729294.1 hypothetical protein KY289_000482 [Solanum tuberosum]KAH0780843.1 hypothetical protein KY290_000441 [Solanum tuberosum]